MANVNPFLEGEEMIEDEIQGSNETIGVRTLLEGNQTRAKVSPDREDITLDNVASKLLQNHFILTALEFHTELVESGRELPRLRDFFSNPANFERAKVSGTELSPTGLGKSINSNHSDSINCHLIS